VQRFFSNEKAATPGPDKPHPEQGQIGKDFRQKNEVARFVLPGIADAGE